ncbi:hypothetical protein IG631_14340 [Alternaria alternata]|nr:hypothetical protein IG631_14340 [Alternaria alternata]
MGNHTSKLGSFSSATRIDFDKSALIGRNRDGGGGHCSVTQHTPAKAVLSSRQCQCTCLSNKYAYADA